MWGAGLWESWGAGLADLGYGLCSVMCRAGKWPLAGEASLAPSLANKVPEMYPATPAAGVWGWRCRDPQDHCPAAPSPCAPVSPLSLCQGWGTELVLLPGSGHPIF